MITPEARSRELAAKASLGPWKFVAKAGNYTELAHELIVIGSGLLPHEGFDARGVALSRGDNAAYIAFHDPSLITAYADVVEAAREDLYATRARNIYGDRAIANHGVLAAAIARLDSLAKDRGDQR